MKRAVGVAIVVIVASAMSGGIASAKTSLLVDGSFERPHLVGTVSRQFVAGQHAGAWSVTSGGAILAPALPPVEAPPVGSQAIALRALPAPGLGDGEICQTVSGMVPNASYQIRFLAASAISASTIDVTFAGARVAHLSLEGGVPARFTPHERTVIAATDSAALCLHGSPLTATSVPIVDSVRFKPVAG